MWWMCRSFSADSPCKSCSRRPAFLDQVGEDAQEDGIAVVVLAVDFLAALGSITFQLPQIGRLLDLLSDFLCLPHDLFPILL
jgi:hypothetical protein